MAVSNGNGNGAVSHLDRLLSEKPPEFQAKVLRFALDSGMKQDDPAFRLVQYIGYLAQLTETAPNDWKLLFENLQDRAKRMESTDGGAIEDSSRPHGEHQKPSDRVAIS